MNELMKYVRTVPDFPKKGIMFIDTTAFIENPVPFKICLDAMQKFIQPLNPDKIVGIEARGFFFGSALADRLNIGFVPARKPGKLPAKVISEEYELEYGTDSLQMHADAVKPGEKVVIVDDLIATGGTIQAVCRLIKKCGGEVAGISTVVELSFLPWREKLKDFNVNYLMTFDSE